MKGPKEIMLWQNRDGSWQGRVTATHPKATREPYVIPPQVELITCPQHVFPSDGHARAYVLREANAIITMWERFEGDPSHHDVPIFMNTYAETQNWGVLRPLFNMKDPTPDEAMSALNHCIYLGARIGDHMGCILAHLLRQMKPEDIITYMKEFGDGDE